MPLISETTAAARPASGPAPARPHTTPLSDQFGRRMNYMRLALTDHCNLRCRYCMPAAGIPHRPQSELLSLAESLRLVGIAADLGVEKLRITGGEPLIRKGVLEFMQDVRRVPGLRSLHLTTNGVLLEKYLPELRRIGLDGINLSLDTLRPDRFAAITRRNEFHGVYRALHGVLAAGMALKVNMVVLQGFNTDEITAMAGLAREYPLEVRFIEKMPFDGAGREGAGAWNHRRILEHLRAQWPELRELPSGEGATAQLYAVPGFTGNIGIIAGFTRLFCGTCNRLRVTAKGMLKTCLYDGGVLDLKALVRSDADDAAIAALLRSAVTARHADGFAAERARRSTAPHESMSAIGG